MKRRSIPIPSEREQATQTGDAAGPPAEDPTAAKPTSPPADGLLTADAPHNLVRNVAINAMGHAILFLGLLLATPLIVDGFGIERFGILSLAWTIVAYFALFDLGIARATTRFAADALGRGEVSRVKEILRASIFYSVGAALMGTVVMGFLAIALASMLGVPSALILETRQLLFWLTASIVPIVMTNTLLALLEARQRFDIVNLVRVPANLLMILVPAGVAWRGGTLGSVGFLLLLVQATKLGIAAVVFRREVARLALSPLNQSDAGLTLARMAQNNSLRRWRSARALSAEASALLRVAGWLTVTSVATFALLSIDRFLVGALLGVGAVGLYAPSYDLAFRVQFVPGVLVVVLFPAFSSWAARDPDAAGRLFLRSTKLLAGVLVPILVILSLFAGEFFRWWLDERFAAVAETLVPIFAIGVFFISLAWIAGAFLQATGQERYVATVHLTQLPLHVIVTWLLIKVGGLEGAAIAWSLRAVISYLFLRAKCRKGPARIDVSRFGVTVLVSALSALGLSVVLARYVLWPMSPALTTGVVGVAIGAHAFAFWRWVLDPEDREALRSATKREGG